MVAQIAVWRYTHSSNEDVCISPQHEIKTGFVFLHSCDGCRSHEPVIELAQSIITRVSGVLEGLQPGPNLPPDPSEYAGNYTTGDVSTVTRGGLETVHV